MKITHRETVYKGFIQVDKLTIELEGGKTVTREVVVRNNAVAALVFDTKTRNYILVKQFRPGPAEEIVEIVAGTMDVEGETPEHCITREIEEEIGYKVDKLEFITWCHFSPGGLTEKIHIFYAEVSEKVSAGGGVEDEDIKIVLIPEEELNGITNCTIHDSKSLIAIEWRLQEVYHDEAGHK